MKLPFILFCFLVAGSTFAQKATDFSEYSDFLRSEITGERIGGAVSLIVKDGNIVHQGAWGYSDKEDSSPMKEDQIFHLMSMTKPIVSVAAMMLWEEGKFKLDDPISKYLPGFEELGVAKDVKEGKDGATVPAKSVPTVRQLLSHTAGFSHGLSGTTLDNDVAKALYFAPQADIASRVKTLTELPLIGQPGEQWSYSASPDVISRLIEVLSGMSTAEYLQTKLFDPLGMGDTGYNMTEAQAARMPRLYKVVDGKLERDLAQMPANGHSVFGGTHGLLSTAADYGEFCQMLLNGGEANGQRFLKASTIALMTQSHIGDVPYRKGQTFGLGFGVSTNTPEDGMDSKGRFYWSGAYSTFFFVDPANDLYAILMTQTSPFTGRYGDALREYVYGAIKR
jgi:CubicO group peptidase (beta-lactamase class C family)